MNEKFYNDENLNEKFYSWYIGSMSSAVLPRRASQGPGLHFWHSGSICHNNNHLYQAFGR